MMGGDLEGKNLGILDFGQINDREIQYFSKNGVLSLVMKAVLPKLAENGKKNGRELLGQNFVKNTIASD